MDQLLVLATWLGALFGLPVLAFIGITSIRREREAKRSGTEIQSPSRLQTTLIWGFLGLMFSPLIITIGWFIGWLDSLIILLSAGLIVPVGLAVKMPERRSQMLVSSGVVIAGILMYTLIMALWFIDSTASATAGMCIATIGVATGMALTVFYFAATVVER